MRADGSPTPALAGRVLVGVSLARAGRASKLVFSGGSPDSRPTEASVMRRLALEAGVAATSCAVEDRSRSTRDNARRCAELLPLEREILLVTCDYHLLRATRLFRAEGFTVFPVASHRQLGVAGRLWLSLREAVALFSASD